MLLSIKIKNFRSIREEIFLDLSKSTKIKKTHLPNVVSLDDNELLKTIIIYGRNASGKSNILKAFRAIEFLVSNSGDFKHGDKIPPYEPFLFDNKFKQKDTEFEIIFLFEKDLKFKYELKYNGEQISYEALYIYPKGVQAKLYIRENNKISYGDYYKGERKNIEENLLKNQLFLSKSANTNIKYLREAYLFITSKMFVSTFHDTEYDRSLIRAFSEMMLVDNIVLDNIKKILKTADTNIIDFRIDKNDDAKFKFPKNIPTDVRKEFIERFKYEVKTNHLLFDNGKKIGEETINLDEESTGTKKLLAIGGIVLNSLKNGGVIIIDELDKSLHPLISKMLINLFHSTKNNPNNAQLIFATHDSSLLDKDIFRRDQIYFVDKEYEGNTILYKLSDIKGVRENIPYDKWYLSGRFNAIPVISDVELTF